MRKSTTKGIQTPLEVELPPVARRIIGETFHSRVLEDLTIVTVSCDEYNSRLLIRWKRKRVK